MAVFRQHEGVAGFIAAEYGNDALFSRKYFADHTAPLMPQAQVNLVKQAFVCGSVKILQDNMASDQTRKEIAIKQAVGKMIDTHATSEEAARRVVLEITSAIGWAISANGGTLLRFQPVF